MVSFHTESKHIFYCVIHFIIIVFENLTLENAEGQIKTWQSSEIGNTGRTKRRIQNKDKCILLIIINTTVIY